MLYISVNSAMPAGYQQSSEPVYLTPTTFSIAQIMCRSDDNTADILKPSLTTVDVTQVGLNGVLSALAANTWYFMYAVTDGVTPGIVLATQNKAGGQTVANLPNGYTKIKQMPWALKSNAAGTGLLGFLCTYKTLLWSEFETSSVYQVLGTSGTGQATSFTGVNCASLVPPIARIGLMSFNLMPPTLSLGGYWVRMTGSGSSTGILLGTPPLIGGTVTVNPVEMMLSASRQFDYRIGVASGRLDAYVMGYRTTEL